MKPINLLSDLEDFVLGHRPRCPMSGEATEPAWIGYLLTVGFRVGVTFARVGHTS